MVDGVADRPEPYPQWMPQKYGTVSDWEWLDENHRIQRMRDSFGAMFGLIDVHWVTDKNSWCTGYVAFRDHFMFKASGHQLISEDPLHVEASLACRLCPNHGWIRDGKWVQA